MTVLDEGNVGFILECAAELKWVQIICFSAHLHRIQ